MRGVPSKGQVYVITLLSTTILCYMTNSIGTVINVQKQSKTSTFNRLIVMHVGEPASQQPRSQYQKTTSNLPDYLIVVHESVPACNCQSLPTLPPNPFIVPPMGPNAQLINLTVLPAKQLTKNPLCIKNDVRFT